MFEAISGSNPESFTGDKFNGKYFPTFLHQSGGGAAA
jgi:hypothetical protein